MDPLTALGAGIVAGLALVVPLGAIGVLLVTEGASRGFVRGIPAATAVATVDTLYCLAAVALGAVLAPAIAAWAPWPQVLGGATLVAIGARGLWQATRAQVVNLDVDARPGWHRYALFLGLTAVNPATVVYFAAVVTGLPALTQSGAAAGFFVAGVAVSSVAWQLLIVFGGAALRWTIGGRVRRITAFVGNGLVVVLGVAMVLTALV